MAKKTPHKDAESKMRKKVKSAASKEPVQAEKSGEAVADQEPATADAVREEPPVEEAQPSPEEEIRALREEVESLKDRLLRAHADFDNYRKRMQRDLQEIRAAVRADTIQEFLGVLDHFEMAMAHTEQQADLATLKQGMDMILAEFRRVFENLGVERIDATLADFDPQLHEAVAQETSEEVPPGKVLRQWKCGYRLGDRLLRPAAVVVSSGAEKPESAEES